MKFGIKCRAKVKHTLFSGKSSPESGVKSYTFTVRSACDEEKAVYYNKSTNTEKSVENALLIQYKLLYS